MQDRTKLDPEIADYLDELRAREELEQHEHDPLDTPLGVQVQAFTVERLRRYMADTRYTGSMDSLVNDILRQWLYDEGE